MYTLQHNQFALLKFKLHDKNFKVTIKEKFVENYYIFTLYTHIFYGDKMKIFNTMFDKSSNYVIIKLC